MIKSVYNINDATIYERYSKLNTGLDQVIELQKTEVSSNQYNSRILLKFDTTELSSSAAGVANPKFYLRLFATEPSEIPVDYTIYAYPISQSWSMGTGRYGSLPTGSDGVTWVYTNGTTASGSWATASYTTTVTASWTTNPGGGTWYTSSVASQSFSYQTTDVNMDITSIALAWISGTIQNNGLIIKKSDIDEASDSVFGSLRFFSKDTHTVYQPRVLVKYDDSVYHTTHSVVNFNDEVVVNITNLQPQYSSGSVVRFNISSRPKYPTRTFATSSNYLTTYQLPSTTYYSLVDAHTDEAVIDFDTSYTKLSADGNGSYFKASLSDLHTDRYYKILIKTQTQSSETYIYDKNWIFKVAK